MKKLFTILAVVAFAGIFTACEEEEIAPDQSKLELTSSGGGSADDDKGQWD